MLDTPITTKDKQKYTIGKRIGGDAQGHVFELMRPWWQQLFTSEKRPKVVKVVSVAATEDHTREDLIKSVEAERDSLAARYNVELIIKGNSAFLVMDRIKGRELHEIIQRGFPTARPNGRAIVVSPQMMALQHRQESRGQTQRGTPPSLAQQSLIMSQILFSVNTLHHRTATTHIIHRDIKPENIVVTVPSTTAPYDVAASVVDDGFVVCIEGDKLLDSEKIGLSGTLGYIAPELILRLPEVYAPGTPDVQARVAKAEQNLVKYQTADVFSLGMVAFLLMVDPIKDINKFEELECLNKSAQDVLPLLQDIGLTCYSAKGPRENIIAQFIEKMLAPEACERPSLEQTMAFFQSLAQYDISLAEQQQPTLTHLSRFIADPGQGLGLFVSTREPNDRHRPQQCEQDATFRIGK